LIEHTTGEGTTKTLRIAAPAVRAHVANHGDSLADGEDQEACIAAEQAGQGSDGGGTDTCNIEAAVVQVGDTDQSVTLTPGDSVTVDLDAPVVSPIDPNFSIKLQGTGAPTQQVVLNETNTSVAEVTGGNLVLTVDPSSSITPALPITGITVAQATGIECEGNITSQVPAPSTGTAFLSGTVTATKSGEPALKTSSGKKLKLSAKTEKGEKRLDALAKKDAKVKVEGKKSGDTLEVTKVKSAKAKKK
jgi:hypothetical protein